MLLGSARGGGQRRKSNGKSERSSRRSGGRAAKKNRARRIAAPEHAGASKRDAKERREARVVRFFTTIGAFQKNFCDCLFCVAGQHAFACYYRLRSVIAKSRQGRIFLGASLIQLLLRHRCSKDFNQANWIKSASQKSAVKPRKVFA